MYQLDKSSLIYLPHPYLPSFEYGRKVIYNTPGPINFGQIPLMAQTIALNDRMFDLRLNENMMDQQYYPYQQQQPFTNWPQEQEVVVGKRQLNVPLTDTFELNKSRQFGSAKYPQQQQQQQQHEHEHEFKHQQQQYQQQPPQHQTISSLPYPQQQKQLNVDKYSGNIEQQQQQQYLPRAPLYKQDVFISTATQQQRAHEQPLGYQETALLCTQQDKYLPSLLATTKTATSQQSTQLTRGIHQG